MPALFSKQESCNSILWVGRDSNPLTARPIRQFVFRLDLQSSAVTYPKFVPYLGIEPSSSWFSSQAIYVSSPLNDRIPTIKAYYIGPSSVWCSVYSNRSIWRRFPRVSNQQGNPNWFYVFDQLSWTPGDLNPILHSARVVCYQVTLPGP